jgi:hypothetical protein
MLSKDFFTGTLVASLLAIALLLFVFFAANGDTTEAQSVEVSACDAFVAITAQMPDTHVSDIVFGGAASSPGVDAVRDLLFACHDEALP